MSLHEPDPLDQALGAVIRGRRKRLNMSQAALADAIGLTFQQVQKYERGTNRVSFSALCRIATALACDAGDLVAQVAESGEVSTGRSPASLLAESGAVELLESYNRINSKVVRQAIVDLSRKLAISE